MADGFSSGAIDADDFIVNFAIDRIKDFRIMDKIVYRPYPKGNINDRYNDLVGITMRQDARMEHVIIWADDLTYNYIRTKHLCRLQYDITGREEENLRASHRNLSDGHFVDLYTLVSPTDGSAEDRSRNYEPCKDAHVLRCRACGTLSLLSAKADTEQSIRFRGNVSENTNL